MLTFLTVEKAESKLLPLRHKIYTELKTSGGIQVKYIKCIHRRGKIPYEKIRRISENQSDCLLTKEDLILPQESKLRRFYSAELSERLCLNMTIAVLKELKASSDNIKVAVFDPEARIADGVGAILKFTQNLTVVTRMTGVYGAEAERIMNESGAVLNVSRRMKSLENAKLVVAPYKLKTQLPLGKDAVILTVAPSAVSQKGTVYYRYYFTLSEDLKSLLPQGFDAEYFSSALYSLLGRFDLGSIVPQATKGDFNTHTLVSLNKYLTNICRNA
ncbi:MAG: hypothetical protein IJW04_03350 [Ruminococcus sp.]|nr:hypothetical protein [Ruminococcus sp.]